MTKDLFSHSPRNSPAHTKSPSPEWLSLCCQTS